MRLRSVLLACTLAVGSVIVPTASVSADTSSKIKPAPKSAIADQYVVVLKAGAKPNLHGAKLLARYNSALNGYAVKASKAQIKLIASDSGVDFVQQDGRVQATDDVSPAVNQFVPAPPDTFWGLNRIDQRTLPPNSAGLYQWFFSGPNVTVYVIDTGIRTTHTQFSGRATFPFTAPGLPSPGVDCHGHGTHVAGIIGGNTYGVAKNVKLRAVKVLGCDGGGSFAQVISGVDFVSAQTARPAVANMSLGGGAFMPLDIAINNSIERGVHYSIAAGNSNDDACNYSPARTLSAITVGSTGNRFSSSAPITDSRSDFSNFGPCVDIFAPGALIRSSYNTSDTSAATLSGTSMAAPHVAGVLANYLQLAPSALPVQARNFLVGFSTTGVVGNPGPGSPNRLLYAGNRASLSANATPEPIFCTRSLSVLGNLSLQGRALSGRTVEVWFDRAGSTPAVFKGTAITNSVGNYARTVSQANDGSWFAVYRGAPLIGSVVSTADFVDCVNRT